MAQDTHRLTLSGHHSSHARVSGFTLIEALIAVFVLGFGLAAIARLQTDLLIENRETKSLAEATALARSQLEALRFQVNRDSPELKEYSGQRMHAGIHETYRIEWRLLPSPGDALFLAEVRVRWIDRFGFRNVNLSTLMTDPVPFSAGHLLLGTASPEP